MVAVTIYVSSDIIRLGFLKGDYAIGMCSVVTKIYGTVAWVISLTMAVAIPRLVMLIGRKHILIPFLTSRINKYYIVVIF